MKIMKKLFSFVCCLFLAVSCFAPFALASDPKLSVTKVTNVALIDVKVDARGSGRETFLKDGYHFILTLVAHPEIRLASDGDVAGAQSYGRPATNSYGNWIARQLGDGYVLHLFGCSGRVLDQRPQFNVDVHLWDKNTDASQQWVFEPTDTRLKYFRVRNKLSGKYLTCDPSRNFRCIVQPLADADSRAFEWQIWEAKY